MKNCFRVRWILWSLTFLILLPGGPSFAVEEGKDKVPAPHPSREPLVILPHSLVQATEAQAREGLKTGFGPSSGRMAFAPQGLGSLFALSLPVRMQGVFGSQAAEAMKGFGGGPVPAAMPGVPLPGMGVEPVTRVPGEIQPMALVSQPGREIMAGMRLNALQALTMEMRSPGNTFASGEKLLKSVNQTTQKDVSPSG